MATIINGTNMVLSVNVTGSPVAIAAATSCSTSITIDQGEVTDKSSGDRKEFIGLGSSWTMDAEAFYTQGTADGEAVRFKTLNTALQAGTRIKVKFSTTTGQTGVVYWDGFAYITSLSVTAAVAEWSTYSISIQGDGALSTT